jgi:hypothetical protein
MPLDPDSGQRPQRKKVEEWRDARATRQLVLFLLGVLVAVSLWPLAAVADWFMSVRRFPDAFGFTYVVLSLRPIVAAAAALSCPIVLVLVVTSHPQLAFDILIKAAFRVGLVALGILLLTPLINGFLAGTTEPSVPVAETIARENAAALSAIVPLVGIAIAFAVIAALSRSSPPPPITSDEATRQGPGPSAMDERLRELPPQPPSSAAKWFNQLTYRVRPRPSFISDGTDPVVVGYVVDTFALLVGLRKYFDDYEIRADEEHFSYSGRSGVLRLKEDGAALFSLSRRADSLTETLDVVDSETGAPVGSFRSRVNGWDIDDALGRPVLFIAREVEEERCVRYIASVGGREVCRYTWSSERLGGLFKVALKIEFALEGPACDRALAVALGPFIEEEARLLSADMRRFDGD